MARPYSPECVEVAFSDVRAPLKGSVKEREAVYRPGKSSRLGWLVLLSHTGRFLGASGGRKTMLVAACPHLFCLVGDNHQIGARLAGTN